MMYRKIDSGIRFISLALLDVHWRSDIIAVKKHCHRSTIYRWEGRQKMYEEFHLSIRLTSGRSRILTIYIKNVMVEFRKQRSWAYHDELKTFLNEEWEVKTNVFTICRTLKEENISRKKEQRFSNKQSDLLRAAWQADMLNFIVEQLIVIDETIFKAQTGWRCMAYELIDEKIRWNENIRRDDVYSVLFAYTIEDYLLCTAIRQGYFNSEVFFDWIIIALLSHCNAYSVSRSVIVMDNVNIHIKARIKEAIEVKGCLIRYLSSYSFDFNSIELTFSLLKVWMRRHWRELRDQFQSDFASFLQYAVNFSECDQYANAHFRYNMKGYESYRFEDDYETFQRELDVWAKLRN